MSSTSDTDHSTTFVEMEESDSRGVVFDLCLAEEYVEYTAVNYPGKNSSAFGDLGHYFSVYMPDSSGLTAIHSWWDSEYEGGREEALEIARGWVLETYAKNQLRLQYIAMRAKHENDEIGIMPVMNAKDYVWKGNEMK